MSTAGMRQAAVMLAGLHPSDRDWLLERLRPTWRYDLKRLIGQAQDLGAGNAALSRQVLARCEKDTSSLPEPPAPDQLLTGLQGLVPEWIARVLASCAPDHLDVYAANAEPESVRSVREALLQIPKVLPSKLAETLTKLVRERGERALATISMETP